MKYLATAYLIFYLGYFTTTSCKAPIDNEFSSHRTENLVQNEKEVMLFLDLLSGDPSDYNSSLDYIDTNWKPSYAAPILDIWILCENSKVRDEISTLLKKHTKQKIGKNPYTWFEWLWSEPPTYEAWYADLKADLYQKIDRRFAEYFRGRAESAKIRLDEILWGGVQQDGIPPLRDPDMIPATDANYLDDSDIIFGVTIDGDSRAYPQRILAWHEMFVDNIAGRRIAGVYCTLCGTVIGYDSKFDDTEHYLGTSGFLYRSNKLMYDRKTQSMWNTILGKPVLGPLSSKNIELNTYPIVTATWGEWKKAHPNTTVLSLNTGHRRDYGTGVAYKQYYATDDLMFPVPTTDKSLKNKDEVFVIRTKHYADDPIAFSVKYLKKKPIVHDKINGENFVIISDKKGGSRAYESNQITFSSYKKGTLLDSNNRIWTLTEEKLSSTDGTQLNRLSSHNVFWFSWYNTFPETRLIK